MVMEVHNHLGDGFLEIVYKDAIEYEFKKGNIPYTKEKKFELRYKGIILDIKCASNLCDADIAQCLIYLKVSQCKLALLVNFGKKSLVHKRIVL
jgi:GxxExxY protein